MLRCMQEIHEKGDCEAEIIKPSVVTFNSVIDAYTKSENGPKVLIIVQSLE
jgi:hypothetical protein